MTRVDTLRTNKPVNAAPRQPARPADGAAEANSNTPPVWREAGLFALLVAATVLMFSFIMPPRSAWPLAFVCLVPWALGVCRIHRAWIIHWGSFLGGWAYFLINLNWLMPVTGLGYVALAFYLAIYWPLAAWAVRTGRRAGISPVWTLAPAWVACEFLRGWVMSGFPWHFVAHAFYSHLAFIQISDITGAYGVTFLAALVNGLLVENILRWWPYGDERPRWANAILGGVATVALLGGSLAYGQWRLQQSNLQDGPRIAVVQEDFPLVSTYPYGDRPPVIFARYLALAAEAAREKPDLLVFPETTWGATQNIGFIEVDQQAVDGVSAPTWAFGKQCHAATSAFARGDYATVNAILQQLERRYMPPDELAALPGGHLARLPAGSGPPVTVLVGSIAMDVLPESANPRLKRYNSVMIYDSDGTQRRERYDKMHLVPFGETVPFRNARFLGMSLHWLYRMLNNLSPFSDGGKNEYSLWSGEKPTVFSLETAGRSYHFGVPICYEDVMPYVPRRFVYERGKKRLDFLLNVSNDGWFLYSDELPQHLAIGVFRAVENRVGIARAVNTGISAFIAPTGRIYSEVRNAKGTIGPGVVGYRVDHVKIDPRRTFYGRFGDVFALACLLFTAALWIGAIITRWIFALQLRVAAWRGHRSGAVA